MPPTTGYVPDRGDLIWIDFDPQVGHEQNGHRPAIVLSGQGRNARTGLAVVCPITRQAKGFVAEVPVPAGAAVTGVVLADHVKSLDWAGRRARYIGPAPPGLLVAVIGGVLIAIS